MIDYIGQLAITTVLGIISFFLKKQMDRSDKVEQKIQMIEKDYVTEVAHGKDIEKLGQDITKIREDYTPKAEFKEVVNEFRNEMKEAQKEFLTKDDFYREQGKMEKKMDKIIDLLMKEGQ